MTGPTNTVLVEAPTNCPDCDVEPGHVHASGCDVERCSVCGLQAISCGHRGEHNPTQTFWTGYWPGDETIRLLHLADQNELAAILSRPRASGAPCSACGAADGRSVELHDGTRAVLCPACERKVQARLRGGPS